MTIERKDLLRPGLTAEEFLELCEQDPDYVRGRSEAEAKREQILAELECAERPLVAALREAGLELSTVWELVNTNAPYTDALPILVEHLQRDYPNRIRDGIARALAVPEAAFAWPILVREYVASDDEYGVKQGLAVALSNTLSEERLDEFLELVRDPRHGESRGLLLVGLQRLSRRKRSRARTAYENLASDPVLGEQVRRVLRRRRR